MAWIMMALAATYKISISCRTKNWEKTGTLAIHTKNAPMNKFLLSALLIVLFASCKNTWNEEDKASFYLACVDDAKTWAGSPDRAKTYCDCVFEKMEKIYPNESDALEHINELTKDTSLVNCKTWILNQK